MPNLQDYYKDLLTWEGVPPRNLVDPWPSGLRSAIENDLVNAVSLSGLIGAICAIHLSSSNQSVGNQVEAFTVGILSPHLVGYRLLPCSGSGYPDKMIIERRTNLAIPLEMKATSDWNPRDSNRRVLTSSSSKLRAQFVCPIYHLLATVIYSQVPNGVRIDHLRLDFLEPTTPVSVRLEASVNHRILATGSHHSRVI
jgi:hypothetical protein